MSTIAERIEELHAAFGDIPKPQEIYGCRCCIDDKNVRTLLSKPLRELTHEELTSYASSAFLTVGDVDDYLYFLPRILEISLTLPYWWPDFEVIGRAIAETRPNTWPHCRREAIMAVFQAAIQGAIREEDGQTIDGLICGLTRTGLEIDSFLKQIEQSPRAVCAYYEVNSESLILGKLDNAFWDEGEAGFARILEWFKSPRTTQIMVEAYGLDSVSTEDGESRGLR